MATCDEIIRAAYRRAGAGAGAAITTLDPDDAIVGMERLQGMYLSMLNGGCFGQFCEKYLESGDYEAKEGERVFRVDPTSTITLPASVVDCETGQTRAPREYTVVVVVKPDTYVPELWLYNAMLGKWQNVYALQTTDVAPLSLEYQDELKDILSAFIGSETGMTIDPVAAKKAGLSRLAIASKYGRKRKANKAEYF